MELATTQSVLMQIQPTIQRFARMLASVLQLEVEIVDENLCRVAGTGAYGKFLGRQLSGNSRLLRHVLETKTEKVVTQSRFDPLCEGLLMRSCDKAYNKRWVFLRKNVILYMDEKNQRRRIMRLSEKYEFRSIHREEAEQAAEIEQICFPPAEAISRADVIDRVEKIPELFLVAVDRKNGKLAGYLTGFTTSEEAFQDKFFTNADLCDPDGKNNMLLGLEVLPKYRGQGLARELMMRYLDREQKRGRERAVLTCVDEKVEMYRRMGFEYIGISASVLGDEKWNEMEYRMKK